MSFGATTGISRGCGKRTPGGAYFECGLSPFGKPLEYFILCPPVVIDPDDFGLRPRQMAIDVREIPNYGRVSFVMDWVGETYYPSPADFLEEVRKFGLSRKIVGNIDLSLLNENSRILVVHPCGWIDDPKLKYTLKDRQYAKSTDKYCPKEHPEHGEGQIPDMCSGLWWETLPKVEEKGLDDFPRLGRRKVSDDLDYVGAEPAKKLKKFKLAIVASFPITQIGVVIDPDGQTHLDKLEEVKVADLPVNVVKP